jgi:hypothetical protein
MELMARESPGSGEFAVAVNTIVEQQVFTIVAVVMVEVVSGWLSSL